MKHCLFPMAQITHDGAAYIIADELQEKYKELIDLVLETPSMNTEEKQYWFKILPIMNKEQLRNLYTILATEQKKLQELDQRYEKELARFGGTKAAFDPAKSKEFRAQLQEKEAAEQRNKQEKAEELLSALDDL